MKFKFTHLLLFFLPFIPVAATAQTQLVTDGGFETGPGGTAWTQSSTNFGTPICNLPSCGAGTGTGSLNGNFWAYFGGFAGGVETGTISQSFVIPSGGTAILSFWLEMSRCDSPQDFLQVKMDGNVIFTADGSNSLCGITGYSLQNVNISAFADGNSHTLEFTSTTFSATGDVSNFFVDDVSVIYTGGTGGCPNILTDGSFEQGPTGTAWTQASTSFGTPVCSAANCGFGSGTGPRTGTYWAWFGGLAGGVETGSVSQSFIFPSNDSITLKFYLEIPLCDGPQDILNVTVDGNSVFQVNGGSALCGAAGYTLQSVDLSSYADGNSHTITFNVNTVSANGTETNFFVDDISVISCPNSSIGENPNSIQFHIAPVPASDYVNFRIDRLTGKESKISVSNYLGQRFHQIAIPASGSSFAGKIETGAWPKGIYLITVENEFGISAHKKLVIQ